MIRRLAVATLCFFATLPGKASGQLTPGQNASTPASETAVETSWQKLAGEGDVPGAIKLLEATRGYSSATGKVAAREKVSLYLEEKDDLGGAIAAQEALLAILGPGHWKLGASRQRLMELHQRRGDLDRLEEKWRKEVDEAPKDPQKLLRLAQLHHFRGDDERQLAALRSASELLPRDGVLVSEVAGLELVTGDLEQAAKSYDRALTLRPSDADLIFRRAEVDALLGQTELAEKRVGRYLDENKDQEGVRNLVQEFYARIRLSAPLEKLLLEDAAAHPQSEEARAALVRFYLETNQIQKASECLAGYDPGDRPSEEVGGAFSRLSGLFREAGLNREAIELARKAVEKNPADPALSLELAGLLAENDQKSEARKVLEAACAIPGTVLPREDLDRQLYLSLQEDEKLPNGDRSPVSAEVRKKINALEESARKSSNESAWLRLGRWKRWSGDPGGEIEILKKGVATLPGSLPLHERLAEALASTGQYPAAIKEYGVMNALAPEREREFRKRIGHLEFEAGNSDRALQIFVDLQQDRPDDWRVLADLALAEQMAGNWFEAFETWLKAWKIAPADSRRGLRQSILNAALRLQLVPRGLDFLETAVAEEKDARSREDLLREAAVFAVKNHASSEWRKVIENRLMDRTQALYWKNGLIFLLEEDGRRDDARALLAATNSGLTQEELEAMLTAAEAAEDWNAAAILAQRLASLDRKAGPAYWLKRAEFQERTGDFAAARLAWDRLVQRYGRSPEVLVAAAQYFERTGQDERMEKCLRKAADLGSCPPAGLVRLGQMAQAKGERSQALEDFETMLALTRPDLAASRHFLPGAPLLTENASRMGESGELRLHAIRETARLLANSPGKAKWQATLSAPMEHAWALYYGGDTKQALLELEDLVSEKSFPAKGREAFAALALEGGEGKLLASWAAAEPLPSQERWDTILTAFSNLLVAGWRPGDALLTEVFSNAPALKTWEAAETLAGRNFFSMAHTLGQKAAPAFSGDSSRMAWIKLAEWRIALRDPDGAMADLDEALVADQPDLAYGGPFFAALRARWLLTREEEKSAFEKRITGHLASLPRKAGLAASEALLAALRGEDEVAARKMGDAFLYWEDTGGAGWLEFVQQGGAQLESWNLFRLARDLYRFDLGRDPSIQILEGRSPVEMTTSLFLGNYLASCLQAAAPAYLNEWRERGVSNGDLLQTASRMQQLGRGKVASLLFQTLCEENPRDEAVSAGILNLAAMPAFRKSGYAFLEKMLTEEHSPATQARIVNAGLRMAAVLEENGETTKAFELLNRLSRLPVKDPTLVLQHVGMLVRFGRQREALAQLESYGATLPIGPSSDLLQQLRRAFGKDSPTQDLLPVSEEKNGEDWPKTFALLDQKRSTLRERFAAGSSLLAKASGVPSALVDQELLRLRKIASQEPLLWPQFYLLQKEVAGERGKQADLEKDLWKEWKQGVYLAGEILIKILIEEKRFSELDSFLGDFLTDRNFNEAQWQFLGLSLLQAGQPELARRVLVELVRRAPGDDHRALALATANWQTGRKEEAGKMYDVLVRLARLDARKHIDLALYDIRTGNWDGGLQHLAKASKSDSRTAAAWQETAAALLNAGRLEDARRAMTETLSLSASLPGDLVAGYFAAQGRLASLSPDNNEFELSPKSLREVRLAIIKRLMAEGETERVWQWMENDPYLLEETSGLDVFVTLESLDWDRAGKVWDKVSSQTTRWSAKSAAAQFYLRRAGARPSAALKDLERAHELEPGSFLIAKVCAEELQRQGKTAAARKVLQDVLAAFSTSADRRSAREMLENWKASPALPRGKS